MYEPALNMLQSIGPHFTLGAVAKRAAVGGAVMGGIGYIGSGGDIKSVPQAVAGGIGGMVSGALRGGVLLGMAGLAGGLAIATSSPATRSMISEFAERNIRKAFSKVAPNLAMVNLESSLRGVADMARDSTMAGLMSVGGGIGATVGLGLGGAIGAVTGAWSAGRNIRANNAYNQYGVIGL